MNKNNAIGVFDSGIGGLTVLKEIIKLLPSEDTIYLGDTARVPYGTKSAETVTRYSMEITDFLMGKGIKLLVVACNTASAFALPTLRKKLDIPVIGVIEPGARAAVRTTRTRKIGIIGTEGTIKSNSYVNAINALSGNKAITMKEHGVKSFDRYFENILDGITVYTKACPLFVPLAEEGWAANDVALLTAEHYLEGLRREEIDTLVLGCTHYPILKDSIAKVMGRDVRLIDSGEETALEVKTVLEREGLLSPNTEQRGLSQNYGPKGVDSGLSPVSGSRTFYVTDAPDRFVRVGLRFLDGGLEHAERVEIP